MSLDDRVKEKISNTILRWWHKHRREFPWRHEKDPYRILITLILLRKTTARQVAKIYDKFLIAEITLF